MKLLVLGKTGQLGEELVARGTPHGFEVTGLGRDELDVTDEAGFQAAIEQAKPDVVINTAAYHLVPECDRNPATAFAVNAAAVKRMAEHCQERGIGFVTYSTDYVFDGKKGRPYVEDDRPNPLQTYGVSKYAGELVCALYHPGALIIRTCGVYGGATGSRSKKGNFILSILRESETKQELEVSSEQIVNPTWSGDLAEGTLALLAKKPAPGMYHLAAEGYCSWAEFAAAGMEIAGRPMKIVPVDRGGLAGALRRPLFSALACPKAEALGVTMPSWREGLRSYLQRLAIAARA